MNKSISSIMKTATYISVAGMGNLRWTPNATCINRPPTLSGNKKSILETYFDTATAREPFPAIPTYVIPTTLALWYFRKSCMKQASLTGRSTIL